MKYFRLEDDKVSDDQLSASNPVFGSNYQTSQIGNRTLRWLEKAIAKKDSNTGERVPFFGCVNSCV
jgi:hypothetical protein